jgi:NADH-quinone oxidoreductase subunit J
MPSFLFYLFVAVMLGFGLNVVLSRNPVTSALSLAVCFVGLAALFISLDAYFIGVIQVLVYTGAVMVLFLFIIMLLDIRAETEKKTNLPAVVGGILLAVIMMLQVGSVLRAFDEGKLSTADKALSLQQGAQREDIVGIKTIREDLKAGTLPDAKLMGLTLFDRYGFHLQAMALLLTVGTVGVVVLSKRERQTPPTA